MYRKWKDSKRHGKSKVSIHLYRIFIFSNNHLDDKTDKSYKICPVIKHLNKVFAESLSNSPFQSVDKHMCKFKGRSSMKQYINNKPIKWVFKWQWNKLRLSIRIVPRMKGENGNWIQVRVWYFTYAKSWKKSIVTQFLIIFSTVPP